MTQQYTGRNNITISMPEGGSVPIVSQTEIESMKTAISLMLAPQHDDGAHRAAARAEAAGAGRLVPARLHRERLILHAVTGCFGRHRDVAVRARVRGDGLRRARTACEMDARGSSLRPSPCRVASRRVVLTSARPSRAASRKAHGRASGLRR